MTFRDFIRQGITILKLMTSNISQDSISNYFDVMIMNEGL